MLVLTRKLGEVIRIGDAVTVRVLEVKGIRCASAWKRRLR